MKINNFKVIKSVFLPFFHALTMLDVGSPQLPLGTAPLSLLFRKNPSHRHDRNSMLITLTLPVPAGKSNRTIA